METVDLDVLTRTDMLESATWTSKEEPDAKTLMELTNTADSETDS